MRKIRVLIVDDSALIRKLLSGMLASDPEIEVVGTAADPIIARERIKQLAPDVLTLDVEMPRMDGIAFLEILMRHRPMPVVMVSSLTAQSAEMTLRALELGAVDYLEKPRNDITGRFESYTDEIVRKVKGAAAARPRVRPHPLPRPAVKLSADAVLPAAGSARLLPMSETVIALGASTGGTEALRAVLSGMPPDAPAIVIAQHIPAQFSGAFAARLDASSAMRVCEAGDGQPVLQGHAYLAPGGRHLLVARDGSRYVCRLHDGPPVNRHKPSVDVLFRSVARSVGARAVGAILTGMGDDGARGLREMLDAGAHTIAQDEASCVVWGMPAAAKNLDAVVEESPLDDIARRIMERAGAMADDGRNTAIRTVGA